MWNVVVLPAPFGPSSPTTSPARTSIETSFTTQRPTERLGERLGAQQRRARDRSRRSATRGRLAALRFGSSSACRRAWRAATTTVRCRERARPSRACGRPRRRCDPRRGRRRRDRRRPRSCPRAARVVGEHERSASSWSKTARPPSPSAGRRRCARCRRATISSHRADRPGRRRAPAPRRGFARPWSSTSVMVRVSLRSRTSPCTTATSPL